MINLKQVFSKKVVLIFIFFLLSLILLNQKLAEIYFRNKLSKWVEKEISLENFKIDYPSKISFINLKINNSKNFKNKNLFQAKNVTLNIDFKTFLFDDLVLINNLNIKKPVFYLELIKKKEKIIDNNNQSLDVFIDNLGLAEKINSDLPDKIWPEKKKDINFLILNTKISKPQAYINIPSIKERSEISMSDFEFFKVGNQEGYRHYKDVLEIMLFDIFARVKDKKIKSLLKEIYKL